MKVEIFYPFNKYQSIPNSCPIEISALLIDEYKHSSGCSFDVSDIENRLLVRYGCVEDILQLSIETIKFDIEEWMRKVIDSWNITSPYAKVGVYRPT